MKKVYVFAPLAALLVFGGFYWQHYRNYAARLAEEQRLETAVNDARRRADLAARTQAHANALAAAEARRQERAAKDQAEAARTTARAAAEASRTHAASEEQKLRARLERLKAEFAAVDAAVARVAERRREFNRNSCFSHATSRRPRKTARRSTSSSNNSSGLSVTARPRFRPPRLCRAADLSRPSPTCPGSAMTKLYLIIPCILVLVFAWFERGARRERVRLAAEHAEAQLVARAAAEARRADARRQAEDDARLRAAAREEQDRLREANRLRDHEIALRTLDEQTARHVAQADSLTRELAHIEALLTARRTEQRKIETETFNLAREVESQRIDRRSAELEIQRTTRIVAARLRESEWAHNKPSSTAP